MTVATLNHEQMVDLLKTSAIVTVTVLPPVNADTPRRGCTLQSCSYIDGSIDGEYDNVVNGDAHCQYGSKAGSVISPHFYCPHLQKLIHIYISHLIELIFLNI